MLSAEIFTQHTKHQRWTWHMPVSDIFKKMRFIIINESYRLQIFYLNEIPSQFSGEDKKLSCQ